MFFALLIHLSATIQYNISVRWLWDSQCHKAASPPQTDGSIAFATLRQCALLWGHNGATWRMLCNRTCDSFRPSESITQTANRSVQPFFHSSQQVSSGIPGMSFPLIIAPSHGMWVPLIHASLGPPKSITQMASGLVQPFCTYDRRVSLYFTMKCPFLLKIFPIHGVIWTPSKTCFSMPTWVLNPNSIWISSAVSAGLTSVTDRQTNHANVSLLRYVGGGLA